MKLLSVVTMTIMMAASGTVIGADIDELSAQCEDCHGPGGVSAHEDVPTIAGQSAPFIGKTLRSFQVWGRPCIKSSYRHGDTSRPATDMCQVAEGLTTEDMNGLAARFSAQPFRAASQAFDAALATRGQALHQEHCESCHESGGTGTDHAPRLAGQWTPFLRKALKFVPTGEHLVPPAMESVITDLGPDDIDALMNYYASQQD